MSACRWSGWWWASFSANIGLGFLIQYGSQIFKLNIVMTAITILAIVSSVMYLAISWLEAAVMRRR
jgi:NitT/TauT family transport system permease protein